MFQPRVKLEFVRRYCLPQNGWRVCVDIDPSEESRTGSKRETAESQQRQEAVVDDAPKVREAFKVVDVSVGNRKRWCVSGRLPYLKGDADIVAYHPVGRRCVVAQVEGASSGQPEQKLYKAIGQAVRAIGDLPTEWDSRVVIVVYGDRIADHLRRMHVLAKLGISGLALADDARDDRWLFGEALSL